MVAAHPQTQYHHHHPAQHDNDDDDDGGGGGDDGGEEKHAATSWAGWHEGICCGDAGDGDAGDGEGVNAMGWLCHSPGSCLDVT